MQQARAQKSQSHKRRPKAIPPNQHPNQKRRVFHDAERLGDLGPDADERLSGSRVRDLGLLFRDFQQKKVRDVDWLGLSPVAKRVRDFGRLVRLIGFCTVFCRL